MSGYSISAELEIKSHFHTAINGVGDQREKAQVEVSIPEKTLHITYKEEDGPLVATFFTRDFQLLRALLKRHIDFGRFLINRQPYTPGALLIKLRVSRKDRKPIANGKFMEGIGVFYYARKDEWYCYRHAARYTRIQAAFSPEDIPCPKCVDEIQKLKKRNRRVCSGCRHDYYNHRQDGSRGVPVSNSYGCWYLREIKNGKCPMYSRR
jgi:hypothetical protein